MNLLRFKAGRTVNLGAKASVPVNAGVSQLVTLVRPSWITGTVFSGRIPPPDPWRRRMGEQGLNR